MPFIIATASSVLGGGWSIVTFPLALTYFQDPEGTGWSGGTLPILVVTTLVGSCPEKSFIPIVEIPCSLAEARSVGRHLDVLGCFSVILSWLASC